MRFIEKLASYNFCENGTYTAVTLVGHDNALFSWNLRIKKHPQRIHSQNHPQSRHFSHVTKRRSQFSLQFPEKPFQAPKIIFKFPKLIGWRSLSNGHLLKDKRLKCVYPSGHLFYFTVKYEILQLHSNGHSFFYSEARYLELYQTAIYFSYSEIQNFENCTQRSFVFMQRNREFWKLSPNDHLYFPQGNTKPNTHHQFGFLS